jgi:CubicO group peptidase (beta-lactamase class C family)
MRVRRGRRLGVPGLVLLLLGCGHARTATLPPPAPPRPAPAAPSFDPSGVWEVRWDRGFSGWWPSIFEGALSPHHDGTRWSGDLTFHQSGGRWSVRSLRVDGDHIDVWLDSQGPGPRQAGADIELVAWPHDGHLVGEMRFELNIPFTPFGGRRVELLEDRSVEKSLPHADPATSGADPVALRTLVERAAAEKTSALVLVHDGKIVLEQYAHGEDGGPMVAMSASKSVVSLAIGLLVAEGRLELDTTLGKLFPESKKLGPKASVTVGQLLSNTSGIDPSRADFAHESIADHTADAKLLFSPGTRFQYNNGAFDFLAFVVNRAARMPLDEFLEARLFRKLDVVDAHWMRDVIGTPRGAGELLIRPVDFAKIGQMMLDGGTWHGERILPVHWVEASVAASQAFEEDYGLGWWREGTFTFVLTQAVLDAWHDLGTDDDTLRRARALLERPFHTQHEYWKALTDAVDSKAIDKINTALQRGDHVPMSGRRADGVATGYAARGWLGQYLVVLPKQRVVAVRMRAPENRDYGEHAEERDGYPAFADDVARVFPSP